MPDIYIEEWPPQSPNDLARQETVVAAARMMAQAAITAPSQGGVQMAECHITHGAAELDKVARKMEELARLRPDNNAWKRMFKYEAAMVRDSDAILFIGALAAFRPFDTGCGYCGGSEGCQFVYERRNARYGVIDAAEPLHPDWLVDGPMCTMNVYGMGWAVGSALMMANRLFVDARPFMSVGMAGQKLGYCPKSPIVVGVPIAGKGKSPFVDILPDYHVNNLANVVESLRNKYVISRMVNWLPYRIWDPLNPDAQKKEG
ncbi:MAG: hypothetical protein C4532_09500 [Candidatus Abyssobacteria bacterium SURF_17]|uniref:DUF2148 domain-containing protein n=1 Tax=Candidatus Abyssobacteria bacterium SURF_17 TaxID=2093361 RepID=A0A419EYM9_9BACT|nr:MAG: hypothetical protein C4532_09500 [Candidatus Abyssubacteria bacterium SURF_17]